MSSSWPDDVAVDTAMELILTSALDIVDGMPESVREGYREGMRTAARQILVKIAEVSPVVPVGSEAQAIVDHFSALSKSDWSDGGGKEAAWAAEVVEKLYLREK